MSSGAEEEKNSLGEQVKDLKKQINCLIQQKKEMDELVKPIERSKIINKIFYFGLAGFLIILLCSIITLNFKKELIWIFPIFFIIFLVFISGTIYFLVKPED